MKSQKELKKEYKTKVFRMGVFQLRNIVNEKIYVDGSLDLDAIWNRTRMGLNFGTHKSALLLKDWKEFGEENFKYEILSVIEHKQGEEINYNKEVKLLTDMYIEELSPFNDKGYNILKK